MAREGVQPWACDLRQQVEHRHGLARPHHADNLARESPVTAAELVAQHSFFSRRTDDELDAVRRVAVVLRQFNVSRVSRGGPWRRSIACGLRCRTDTAQEWLGNG